MIDYSKESNESLIQRTLNGDENAFSGLVKRYENFVRTKAYLIIKDSGRDWEDSKDIAQEVFLKVHSNLQTLEKHQSFTFWISTITKRLSLNAKRKPYITKETGGDEELEDLASDNPLPDKETERNELSQLLEKYLAELGVIPTKLHRGAYLDG